MLLQQVNAKQGESACWAEWLMLGYHAQCCRFQAHSEAVPLLQSPANDYLCALPVFAVGLEIHALLRLAQLACYDVPSSCDTPAYFCSGAGEAAGGDDGTLEGQAVLSVGLPPGLSCGGRCTARQGSSKGPVCDCCPFEKWAAHKRARGC